MGLTRLVATLALIAPAPILAAPAGTCTPVPSARIGFQLATVMPGFMPPGAVPAPSPDPARMRAGTAGPPMPRLAPDPRAFERTLAALHRIGYRHMERFAGTLLLPPDRYAAILHKAGMKAVSSHGSLDAPEWSVELAQAEALGQTYVGSWGFGTIGLETLDHVLATAENLNRLGREAQAHGLRLMVHDHEAALRFRYPYDLRGDGRTASVTAWEIVAARTDPQLVDFEVDVHWARKALGSQDALIRFLQRNRERIGLLHVKDTAADGSVTDLGRGTTDWPRVFAAAGGQVRYFIWEYERPADPLASAAIAFDYLRCRR